MNENDDHEVIDESLEDEQPLTIVGIGGSAGALAALQAFFDALPVDTGAAFVVVTHMDPERESMLPELLQSHTEMPVRQVHDLLAIEPDHVYVIPPARRILVTDKHLDVEEFEKPRGHRTPIDDFFRSLAKVHKDPVVLILSGGGTDGAVGSKAIKEQGGLLLVQDPQEAEYDSMPRAAIGTGLADMVLPVAQLAEKLVSYRHNGLRLRRRSESLDDDELEAVYRILTQVQLQTGHDFSQYKRSTILRRMRRRMQLHGIVEIPAYLNFMRRQSDEAQMLFNDLLIGVTNFFRDADAWHALGENVIPGLFQNRDRSEMVRVWSIGCATGEEAYTLAILLMEHRATLDEPVPNRPDIQVFASDLNDEALNKAREGLYPSAIEADVSAERLARFFTKEGNYYRVKRDIRDAVLFTRHSVLRDPPFTRLDLVSCRNLLIYLNRDLQESVLQIFHYALRPEKFLFLGSSESADMVHEFFRNVDKMHRLYQARPRRTEYPRVPTLPLAASPAPWRSHAPDAPHQVRPGVTEKQGTMASYHLDLLEESAPASVLVDDTYQIVHLSNEAGRYLQHPGGAPTGDFLKLVRRELRSELRRALFQAFQHNRTAVSVPVPVQFNGAPRTVVVAVRPQLPAAAENAEEGAASSERLALVFFLEDETDEPVDKRSLRPEEGQELDGEQREALLAHLEGEVQRLRERLQSTSEEYESSNEELKAANEELQSINEEYRSTTEELETSKEELQSVNEELQTVNAELKNKLEEISVAHSDLENLMAATEMATLFLDQDLRIKRYTPAATELFNIMPGDRGRPIEHLSSKLDYAALVEDSRRVLRDLAPIEREVQGMEERWYSVRLRPYRTVDDRIDGVVFTFVDITELKQAQLALEIEKGFSEKIVHTVREGLLVLDPDLRVAFANESFYEMFDVSEEQTMDQPIYELGNGQWDIPELRNLLEEILPQSNVFNDYRVEHAFDSIGYRVLLLNARRLDHVERIMLAIEDITARERHEHELLKLNEALEERVHERTKQVRALSSQLSLAEQKERDRVAQVLHDDLQQHLYALKLQFSEFETEVRQGHQDAVLEELAEVQHILPQAIDVTRHLSMDLSPPILHDEGLTEAIKWLGSHMGERFDLHVDVQADDSFVLTEHGLRTTLFQIVRELLFNVVKHANTSEATVVMQKVDGRLRITVQDHGAGFDVDALLPETGKGLSTIRRRLNLLGGKLEIESAPGEGSRVTVVSPQLLDSDSYDHSAQA